MKIKLYEKLPIKDIKLLEGRGYEIDKEKEYSREELKSLLLSIETDIMNCSTKNGDMDKMRNEFSNIMNFLENNLK